MGGLPAQRTRAGLCTEAARREGAGPLRSRVWEVTVHTPSQISTQQACQPLALVVGRSPGQAPRNSALSAGVAAAGTR